MKRNLTTFAVIIVSVVLLVSCGGATTFQDQNISLELPAGWSSGIIKPARSYVMITTISKNSGDSLLSIISEVESDVADVSSVAIPGGMMVTGIPNETQADILFQIGDILVPRREAEIEAKRLKAIGVEMMENEIYNLAEINTLQMAYFMMGAKNSGITVSDEEVNVEVDKSFEEAESSGSSKDLFLRGWGISENEFREIIKQKLVYSSVIKWVDTSFADLNEAESATEYLTQLAEVFSPEYPSYEAGRIRIAIIEKKDCFVILEGVTFDFNQDENVESIIDSFASGNQSLPIGMVYIFSPNR